jgi:hypothetical protein
MNKNAHIKLVHNMLDNYDVAITFAGRVSAAKQLNTRNLAIRHSQGGFIVVN